MPKVINLNYELWPKQLEAFRSPATERLYGGAAGGGKSHLERVESIALCLDIPGLNYFLFRRNFQDLVKSYIEGPSGYRQLLGPLIHDPDVKNAEIVAKEIRFPIRNGLQSKIFLCHCQHAKEEKFKKHNMVTEELEIKILELEGKIKAAGGEPYNKEAEGKDE